MRRWSRGRALPRTNVTIRKKKKVLISRSGAVEALVPSPQKTEEAEEYEGGGQGYLFCNLIANFSSRNILLGLKSGELGLKKLQYTIWLNWLK